MPSSALKLEALHWLRYGKSMPIVCTEAGMSHGLADVIGLNTENCIEVEVKISKADLKREWKSKASKHLIYASPNRYHKAPNYFYFLVPEAIADYACQEAEANNKAYGVLVPKENKKFGDNLKSVRKATKLHDKEPSPAMVGVAIRRMSSELVGLHKANQDIRGQIVDKLTQFADGTVHQALLAAGPLTLENADHLLAKAMELAFCVEGINPADFALMDAPKQDQWLQAAQKLVGNEFGANNDNWLVQKIRAYK